MIQERVFAEAIRLIHIADTDYGVQEQPNQPSSNSMASGHGHVSVAYPLSAPEGPYAAPSGQCWGSGGHLSGGSGSDIGSWKQIAPEDAPAWCYKLHVASSQVRRAQSL